MSLHDLSKNIFLYFLITLVPSSIYSHFNQYANKKIRTSWCFREDKPTYACFLRYCSECHQMLVSSWWVGGWWWLVV